MPEFEADQCPHCGFRYDREALGQLAYQLYTTTNTNSATSRADDRTTIGFGFCESCKKDLITVVKCDGDSLEIILLKPSEFEKAFPHSSGIDMGTPLKPYVDPGLN